MKQGWGGWLRRWVGWRLVAVLAGGCGPAEEAPLPEPEPERGRVEALAHNCQTACGARKIITGAACQDFTGFGDSTYVGGCAKACKTARRAAETKAASVGCEVLLCTDSCS